MNWDVWGPPLIVLGTGAVLGAALALRTLGQGRRSKGRAGEVLEAKREQLLEALHEVDADRAKLGEERWREKREQLVDRAADTLRRLDQGDAPGVPDTPTVVPPSAGTTAPKPASSGAGRLIWAVGGVGFFAALAYALTSNTNERSQGQPMTGGNSSQQPDDSAAEAAKAALEKNPNDLDALNTLTWSSIRSRDLNGAMNYLDQARKLAPEDPYVLTHLAVLQLQIGMVDRAEDSLNKALATRPIFPRALIFLGLARLQKDDREGAIEAEQQALAISSVSSEERQMASSLLAEAQAPPPQTRLTGDVALAQGATAPANGTLFVYAKRSADGGGPPVAALRLPASGLPEAFEITDKDMMMGGDWPDQVWLQARVDTDGNPSTHSDTDMESAVLGPLSSGSKDLHLVLQPGAASPAEASAPTEAPATSEAPTASEAPAAVAGARVQGTITVAPGKTAPSGTLFIIARRAASGGGPPVAAARVPNPTFPLTWSLSDQDMMMGGDWPDQVWIQARVDTDGNAMSHSPDDLESAVVGPISSGATGTALVLGAGG